MDMRESIALDDDDGDGDGAGDLRAITTFACKFLFINNKIYCRTNNNSKSNTQGASNFECRQLFKHKVLLFSVKLLSILFSVFFLFWLIVGRQIWKVFKFLFSHFFIYCNFYDAFLFNFKHRRYILTSLKGGGRVVALSRTVLIVIALMKINEKLNLLCKR